MVEALVTPKSLNARVDRKDLVAHSFGWLFEFDAIAALYMRFYLTT